VAHLDRGRDSIGEHIGLVDAVNDAATSREHLRACAERTAADTGRILGIRADDRLVDRLVRDRGVHRVERPVAPGNAPSTAVARRLGMTREGVLREHHPHRGERLDIEVRSVLAPERRRA
jgi:RimJ/RimL family protein N-acetyltransferase